MKTSKRNWVVVVDNYGGEPTYLGKFDGESEQCGVRRLENAIRFTKIGAQRVLKGWPTGVAEGRAWVQEVTA